MTAFRVSARVALRPDGFRPTRRRLFSRRHGTDEPASGKDAKADHEPQIFTAEACRGYSRSEREGAPQVLTISFVAAFFGGRIATGLAAFVRGLVFLTQAYFPTLGKPSFNFLDM